MVKLREKSWVIIALLAIMLGACATIGTIISSRGGHDRGHRFTHNIHENEGLDCDLCHELDDSGWPGMPDHDMCSVCHEIDEDNPDDHCARCHTRPDQSIDPAAPRLSDEVRFSHQTHDDGGVECATCHADSERRALQEKNIMDWCMDCHAQTNPELNECSVCHTVLDKDVRPTSRQGIPIAHGNPQLWEKVHGRESRRDLEFCLTCHDHETSCEECHRRNPPDSHNLAWRRRSHGVRASWDRQNCAVCHEEDSCVRCHQKTTPVSHGAGWGPPHNRHCVSCHFPPSNTGCAVCHENIEHRRARISPHTLGIYGECSRCHPGAVPYRAPHIMNTSVRCIVCH